MAIAAPHPIHPLTRNTTPKPTPVLPKKHGHLTEEKALSIYDKLCYTAQLERTVKPTEATRQILHLEFIQISSQIQTIDPSLKTATDLILKTLNKMTHKEVKTLVEDIKKNAHKNPEHSIQKLLDKINTLPKQDQKNLELVRVHLQLALHMHQKQMQEAKEKVTSTLLGKSCALSIKGRKETTPGLKEQYQSEAKKYAVTPQLLSALTPELVQLSIEITHQLSHQKIDSYTAERYLKKELSKTKLPKHLYDANIDALLNRKPQEESFV